MHLEKNRTYACTFPVQRKEINVVKVRFTMRYSSRKLSNEKVITTACNFWRQIACYFQVKSENVLLLGRKIFEIRHFFKPGQGIWAKKFTHTHYVFPQKRLIWRIAVESVKSPGKPKQISIYSSSKLNYHSMKSFLPFHWVRAHHVTCK